MVVERQTNRVDQYTTPPVEWRYTEPSFMGVASDADYEACREVMRAASVNYSFATAFLPAGKRHHVEALYALLRVGDDRVDVAHAGFNTALEAIDDWEQTYWRAFETGDSPHPVMRAYLNTALACDIPIETMVPYFRAMKEDLIYTRFPTFAHLMHYMDGSTIPVGRAMTHILGVREPFDFAEALARADSLAVAMQLSNFWRDVGQDWDIGRVYIPQEDLERFGVTESELAAGRLSSRFIDLMEFEIQRTESLYAHARPGVAMLAAGEVGVMAGLEVYRAILHGIRRNGYDVFARRAGTSRWRKLGLFTRAAWRVWRTG
jgi:phytoene synthase